LAKLARVGNHDKSRGFFGSSRYDEGMNAECKSTVAPLCAVIAFGLVASVFGEDDLQPPKVNELNKLRKLPDHWRCKAGFSLDTHCGTFESSEYRVSVSYGIYYRGGEKAQNARPDKHKGFKWHRTGRIGDTKFSYLLSKQNVLYITFPDEGPANYSAFIRTNEEIAYILELVCRHRHRLLASEEARER
jgi:hypothetical protein